MEPPLRRAKNGLGEASREMRVARLGRSLLARSWLRRGALHSTHRAMPGETKPATVPRAMRQPSFCADRRTGLGCAMFRLPSPGPVWAAATLAPERSARLRRLSLAVALVGPGRHRRGRRYPTASGFGRFPPFLGERKTLTHP